ANPPLASPAGSAGAMRNQARISAPLTTRVAREQSTLDPARQATRPPSATPQSVPLVPLLSAATAAPKPSPPRHRLQGLGKFERYASVSLTRNRVPLSCMPVRTYCAEPNDGSPEPTEYGRWVSRPTLAWNHCASVPRAAANRS